MLCCAVSCRAVPLCAVVWCGVCYVVLRVCVCVCVCVCWVGGGAEVCVLCAVQDLCACMRVPANVFMHPLPPFPPPSFPPPPPPPPRTPFSARSLGYVME